ncbi:CHAP domain-containing protein [Terrabacter sp. Ter38]|uniref:CHAP domain-containing protein n=1 Tax=Terrabacter sp. Ter38 TaxID=2926030 RepID=UPI0021179002|nr:CHAP domain-containing protein [Terrabacter sp. Ter38]
MNTENIRGRHRAPGRHNPLNELKLLARESAQPAMKAGAVVAATGGLVATFANPASADTLSPSSGDVAAAAGVDAAAPAAVGPATAAAPATSTALSKIGFAPAVQQAVAQRVAPAKPQVIEDVQVKTERAAAKAASERKAATQRASRDLTRATLTTSTSSAKASVNVSVPSASSGVRGSSNWATPGQCTWGALNQWYQSEGYYPGGWTGNARTWASGAAASGYTVSGTPRTRSILVMQPGVHGSSSAGHVAWVTAVNGNEVTIIEMNALAGAYNYNTRTLTDGPGMRYIYAP